MAGEALARDFLKLEARKDGLEEKRWKYLEELQSRQAVETKRRAASLTVLNKRLRSEEKQHSVLKERNLVIRQQAAALSNPGASEVVHRIRAHRQRFALDAERQSLDWNQRIEAQLRQEIASCYRDAQHCRQRQGEAIEVALQQEKLMAELAEAQSHAQEERVKLFEDVKVQQERLRQRLWERRQLMDDRVKDVCQAEETSKSQRRESPEQTLPRPAVQSLAEPGGYVPREGTRQAEVYRQLLRNEAEMASELRLIEDRWVSQSSGSRQSGPDICVPRIAQGPSLQSLPEALPMHFVLASQVNSAKPSAPAFTSLPAPTVMETAAALAARSLERLATRREEVQDVAGAPASCASCASSASCARQESRPSRSEEAQVIEQPELGKEATGLLDLGVLDVPLPSLPRRMPGNDWYGSSSSSTPKAAVKVSQDDVSSAEDVAFVEEAVAEGAETAQNSPDKQDQEPDLQAKPSTPEASVAPPKAVEVQADEASPARPASFGVAKEVVTEDENVQEPPAAPAVAVDLGLNDSEDEDVPKDLLPSVRKAKRSNPLARGRGRGLLQGDSNTPWAGLSGVSQVSFSKLKANKSALNLGGPIDWTQKEDFR